MLLVTYTIYCKYFQFWITVLHWVQLYNALTLPFGHLIAVHCGIILLLRTEVKCQLNIGNNVFSCMYPNFAVYICSVQINKNIISRIQKCSAHVNIPMCLVCRRMCFLLFFLLLKFYMDDLHCFSIIATLVHPLS